MAGSDAAHLYRIRPTPSNPSYSFRRSKRGRQGKNGLTEHMEALLLFYSFRRSERRRQWQNGSTEYIEALLLFHSFQRSREMAGNADSFRRSKRGRQGKNGLTEPMAAPRIFHSFRRSQGNTRKRYSFRRSNNEEGERKERIVVKAAAKGLRLLLRMIFFHKFAE